jgi:hypothetical protein
MGRRRTARPTQTHRRGEKEGGGEDRDLLRGEDSWDNHIERR